MYVFACVDAYLAPVLTDAKTTLVLKVALNAIMCTSSFVRINVLIDLLEYQFINH